MPNTAWEKSFARLYGVRGAISKNISRLKRGGFFKHAAKTGPVLDLFCGKCETGLGLRRIGFHRIVGIDYSAALLKAADDTLVGKVCSDAKRLPIKAQSFSAVVIQGGLHHLQNLDEIAACLSSVRNVIRPGGVVFISEPSDTLLLRLWLFFITKTVLWKALAYTRNWHALHMEEKTTHERYLKNIVEVRRYLRENWTVLRHSKGLVTDLFLLRPKQGVTP